MSAVMSWRGEGGIVTALHLQCPLCGHFSKSHAHLLIHMANTHPTQLDHMTVGRLGNAVIYQSTARLFHCSDCFFTTREFTKLYDHLITTHCMEEGGGGEEHSLKRKRSEEEAEGERKDEGNPSDQQTSVSKTGGDEGVAEGVAEGRGEGVAEGVAEGRGEGVAEDVAEGRGEGVAEDGVKGAVLVFDGSVYRCLTCGWKHKLKALGINHLVRKHDIPKAYANLAVRQSPAPSATPKPPHAKPSEEEEEEEQQRSASTNLLREEMEATAKVIHFTANRFICRICGWKTKLKGFAISHVVRTHTVERPYVCQQCGLSFFLPSHLQQHRASQHRPGRYGCPYCCFRSPYLGGFRRHCSRCNARAGGGEEEEEEEGGERGRGGEEEEEGEGEEGFQ